MELSKRQMTILGIVVLAISFYFLFLKEEEDEENGYSLFRRNKIKNINNSNANRSICDDVPECDAKRTRDCCKLKPDKIHRWVMVYVD
jgi:hypothetical protein